MKQRRSVLANSGSDWIVIISLKSYKWTTVLYGILISLSFIAELLIQKNIDNAEQTT